MEAPVEVTSVDAFIHSISYMEASTASGVSIEAAMEASIASISSMEASIASISSMEASMKASVGVLSVKASMMSAKASIVSMKASMEAFVEAPVEVSIVEAFSSPYLLWKLPRKFP